MLVYLGCDLPGGSGARGLAAGRPCCYSDRGSAVMLFAALVVFVGLNIGQGVVVLIVLAARGLIALAVRLGLSRPQRRVVSYVRSIN